MKIFSLPSFILLAAWAYGVAAVVVPGASTPLFYLVSTSPSIGQNLLPLRINGGTNGLAALTGTGAIGKLYFVQGQFVAQNPDGSSNVLEAYINATPAGDCTTFGQLGFGSSGSNKCALRQTFQLESDSENSQLGARLVFNFVGGFYSCGGTQDVYYKTSADQAPDDCVALDLYTVPVEA